MRNDEAYANAAFITDGESYPARWDAEAARFRAGMGKRARLGLPYAEGERRRFDLFLPEGEPRGVLIFVHGGYWRAFGRETWSHLAAGPLGAGFAVAIPSYTLAPAARIGAITAEIAQAVAAIAEAVEGTIRLAGHSAGGHLVARMLCADVPLAQAVRARIAGVVPISPLGDLRALLETSMNADLRLDAAEAEAESPTLRRPLPGPEVTVWVGGDERPAFLDQARGLARAWEVPCHVAPGRHHFDVIAPLAEPWSDLTAAVTGQPKRSAQVG